MINQKLSSFGKKIKEDNYLSNCYRRLIREKIIHFLFFLIESLLFIIQEIDIINREFKSRYKSQEKKIISPIILLVCIFDKFPIYLNYLIIILSMLIFNSLYIYFCKNDLKQTNIFLSIIINILELFYFRLYILFFYTLLFTLSKLYFLSSFILSLIQAYLIINNFLYNHLYYYVPKFVDYPYDEFNSRFDLFLFLSKILLSVASDASEIYLAKFCFIILFALQIYFSFYYIDKLINQSYLFMKNSFINKSKISLFLTQTTIILVYLFIKKNNITLNIVINTGILFFFMGYLYFIYDPYSYINIENDTPLENIFYYLNIINERNDFEFLIESKLNIHYNKCGFCLLCERYLKYRTEEENYENINQNCKETDKFIIKNNNNKKIIYLFDVICDEKIKYFEIILKMIKSYKKLGKHFFSNNAYYYINLSYLIYSDYQSKNITLALNEKIILEIMNKENKSFLENHKSQINQLIICNDFIFLSKKVLKLFNNILEEEQNIFKAQKLISLSKLLNNMKNKNFKNNLFNHKEENVTNTKNILLSCSIIYEEIFNTTINNSHIPIRDNIQPLEEILNISNKNNNVITLEVDLCEYNCLIIRAGKGLSSYISHNLYDLFPNVFKQHQIDIFLHSLFNGYNNEQEYIDLNEKTNIKKKEKSKKEYIEIKIIINEIISNKIYYKLLALKLTPFFNEDNNHFILFNGTYILDKNIIISFIKLNYKSDIKEIIFGVSSNHLEYESNNISLKNYILWQSTLGNTLTKLFSYKINERSYNIYTLEDKKNIKKKVSTRIINKVKAFDIISKGKENDKNEIYRDTNSASSSTQISNYSKGISSKGFIKIKKDKISGNSQFSLIQKIIYFSLLFILILILIQYYFFQKMENNINNNHNSYINYRNFYRLYYQLFSSILGVTCIPYKIESQKCRSFIYIFNEVYSKNYPEYTFDFSEYLLILNKLLAQKIVEEKNVLNKINNYLGSKKYNELFESNISYFQINQRIINQKAVFSTKELTINFFEAILILCNSFSIITENSNNTLTQPIYFLNKSENPFVNLYNQNEITNYQEEIYKLIINYKYYSKQFSFIDSKLYKYIDENSILIRILIFLFINLDTILLLFVIILVYSYLISFNKIIIRILDYTIMILNLKDKDFDFKQVFAKKLENLQIILELYKSNPLTAIQNLNKIYYEYNKYRKDNKQNNINNNSIKKNDKYLKENKKDKDIPKNQQNITIKDINKLNIHHNFAKLLIVITIILLLIYIFFILMWMDYFSKKDKIFNIIKKNIELETACYEAINIYELMIFNNYTIDEMINYMEYSLENNKNDKNGNGSNLIFDKFYKDLYLVFEVEKDKENIGSLYEDFDDLAEFTCENAFYKFQYEILESIQERLPNVNPKKKLTDICINMHVADSKDVKTIYERHFQFIKNGMLSLTDFSFDGLNNNLNNLSIGRSTFFFLTTTINLIELTTSRPHIYSIKKILGLLSSRILTTGISFLIIGISFIFIILFFYIYEINKFYKQFYLLRKVFKISERQEQ